MRKIEYEGQEYWTDGEQELVRHPDGSLVLTVFPPEVRALAFPDEERPANGLLN